MKNKLKKQLKPLILYVAALYVISSCTNNEEPGIPVPETQNLQNTFTLEHFNDDFIKENLIIHWEDFKLQQDQENNRSIYEFNTSLKAKSTLENGKQTLAFTYKLLAFQDSDGNQAFELIKFLSNDNTLNNISYFNPASFSGTLYHYNLKGENTTIKAYKDGELINEFTDAAKGIIDAQSKAPEVAGCEEGCYVLIFTDHYTDYYLSINNGMFTYAYSVYNGTTSEWVWVSGSGGGGGDSYHYHFDYPHGPNIGANNHTEENIIIDPQLSQDYPCQSDIVQEAYGVCSPLTQLILDAFEANDGTNLVYKSADDTEMQNITAYTKPIYSYNPVTHTCDVIIRIRESYLETATDLSIARTVIHESLHATFVYMFEEGMLTLPDGTADPGFADLANAHINYIMSLGSIENLGKAHHELMASLVGDIATSLSQYGQQNGYNLSPQFYNDMAWAGLTQRKLRDNQGNVIVDDYGNEMYEETPWFQLAVPDPEDRDRIINRLAAEVANQTVDTETPSGQPCAN